MVPDWSDTNMTYSLTVYMNCFVITCNLSTYSASKRTH